MSLRCKGGRKYRITFKRFCTIIVCAIMVLYIIDEAGLRIMNCMVLHWINGTRICTSDMEILKRMGSRDVNLMVKPDEMTTYIHPSPNLILKNGSNPEIVIMVFSTAEKSDRRQTIRQTWYQWSKNYNTLVFFFVGFPKSTTQLDLIQILEEENKIYGDLIVDDFEEDYYRLSTKTLRMMKWFLFAYARSNNPPPKYLVKTDHDVFINFPNLVFHLNSVELPQSRNPSFSSIDNKHYYIGGQLHADPEPDPNPFSKFYLTKHFWLNGKNIFPTYVAGPCYILSSYVAGLIFNASSSVPLFPFEDVYVSGIIARDVLNLTISDIRGIRTLTTLSSLHDVLQDDVKLKQFISIHPVELPELMYKMYSNTIYSARSQSIYITVKFNLFTLIIFTLIIL